ncbi:MAG: AMP-binding protein [Proteiniphilum sp.]|jgi:long-chain acyl-CoA synthetase|nr:AMP-binding protein [Proteiniphilum sp.]
MGKTIITLLRESVEKYRGLPYLYEARQGTEYTALTYGEVQEHAIRFAAGLMALGLRAGERVSLISEGKNNWVLGELGILHAGAVCVPLSVKLETEQDITFRVNHSDSVMVLASDQQIAKLRPMKEKFTTVKRYILLDPVETVGEDEIYFDAVLALGDKLLETDRKQVEERMAAVEPDSLANISYTSGTTANPKGIMLSHDNYVCNAEQAVDHLNGIPSYFKTLLILPWDHSFGHTAGIYSFMKCGAAIASVAAGKSAMEILRNVPKSMKAINPHLLMSVPALAANFRKNIEAGIEKQGKTAWRLFRQGLKVAYAYNGEGHNRGKGKRALLKPLVTFYDRMIFSKIRQNFASNLQYFIGGGALLDIELQRFFYAIGIPMYQGYGLSEASPIISANCTQAHKLGSSGKTMPRMDIRIGDEAMNPLPVGQKGEILIRGGNVMKGYWKNPEATAETIVDGWLRTGDMGYLDSDGYLYVLGRTKSLLISNDGEKFSPEGIEESITAKSEYIDQCVLHNNQSPYTTALLTVNKEALKRRTADPSEAVRIIAGEIAAYMKGGKYDGLFPYRWIPTAFAIIEEPFSEKNGMVNSTMKIVKHKVYERYAKEIEMLHTPDGKKSDSEHNLKILLGLLS